MRTIYNPDIAAALIRGLHLKERTPVPTLHPEIQGVVIVRDLSRADGIIGDPPTGYAPFWGRTTQGAVAAVFSKCRLCNPSLANPQENRIVAMEGIYVVTVGDFLISLITPLVGGTVTGSLRDGRVPQQLQSSKALTEQNTSAASDTPVGAEILSVQGGTYVPLDGVIFPDNFMLSVQNAGLNVGITVTFLWKEYTRISK